MVDRYYFGRCSTELAKLFTPPYSYWRSTLKAFKHKLKSNFFKKILPGLNTEKKIGQQ